MKFSILALGAAVASIASIQQCAAQSTIVTTAPVGASEGRLVSQVADDFFGASPSDQSSSSDAPFSKNASARGERRDPESLQSPSAGRNPTTTENSLRVTTNATRQAPMEVLAGTPDIAFTPVCWGQAMGGCVTPNPVADYMMRNWCVNGLWDTYPCQNARQCQHIQHHIHGVNRYGTHCYGGACCGAASSTFAGPYAYPTSAFSANTSASAHASNHDRAVAIAPIALPSNPAQLANCAVVPTDVVRPTGEFEATTVVLPPDVPTVPVRLQTTPAIPQMPAAAPIPVVPADTSLPAMPVPSTTPVIASLPSATFR